MTQTVIWTIAILVILGTVLAVVLYVVAEKFKVEEDPRIDEVEKVLPGANCGGCGFAGCRAMSEALVKNDNIDALYCPVAGGDVKIHSVDDGINAAGGAERPVHPGKFLYLLGHRTSSFCSLYYTTKFDIVQKKSRSRKTLDRENLEPVSIGRDVRCVKN